MRSRIKPSAWAPRVLNMKLFVFQKISDDDELDAWSGIWLASQGGPPQRENSLFGWDHLLLWDAVKDFHNLIVFFLGFTSPKNIDRIFFKIFFRFPCTGIAQEFNLAALELSRLFQTKCEIECDKELPNALNYYEFVVLLTQVKAGSRLKSFRGFLGRCLSIEMFQGCWPKNLFCSIQVQIIAELFTSVRHKVSKMCEAKFFKNPSGLFVSIATLHSM